MLILWIILTIIVLLILIYLLIVFILVLVAFKVKGPWDTNGKPWIPSLDKKEDLDLVYDNMDWFRQNGIFVSVKSKDGLTLKGKFFKKDEAKLNIIMVHGYRGLPEGDFAFVNNWLKTLNVNILCIYHRGSYPSEGKTITMGYLENEDVHSWFDFVNNDNNLPILLWGLSMGCASVLMSFQKPYNNKLIGVVADCGYTSIENQLKDETRKYVGVFSPFVFLTFKMWQKIIYHFSMKKFNTTKTINNTDVPILFVHGEMDKFVSPKYTKDNYQAYRGKKDILLVKDATHARSFYLESDKYKAKVMKIIKPYL